MGNAGKKADTCQKQATTILLCLPKFNAFFSLQSRFVIYNLYNYTFRYKCNVIN